MNNPAQNKIKPTNKILNQFASVTYGPDVMIRPMTDNLADGIYSGTIHRARIIRANGKTMLAIDVLVTDEDSNETEESFLLKEAFRQPSSTFYKLLVVTGCMPGRGEGLDVNLLVNQRVLLTLKNVDKNGTTHTNIVDVVAITAEESNEVNDTEIE